MKRVALYPFTSDSFPLLQYLPIFRPDYQIVEVLSPLGTGFSGRDASVSVNRSDSGMMVSSDVQKAMTNCDVLLVPYGKPDDPVFSDACALMKRAAEMGRDIWCGMKLTQKQIRELSRLCRNHQVEFCYGFQEKFRWRTENYYGNYKPSIPVVLVHNLTGEADSFEVTLALTQRFQKDGYRVSTLGGRPEYNFLGLHGASLFLETFYGNSTLKDVPLLLQMYLQYFRFIEAEERPDVILVNFPGAAIANGNLFFNESGVLIYLFTQAIRPDYAVVCTLYHEATPTYLQVISQELENRFGIGMDSTHISNRVLHSEQSRQKNKMETFYLPAEQAFQQAQKLKTERATFCAICEEEKDELYNHIIGSLTDYNTL